jgi:hypothetical protein
VDIRIFRCPAMPRMSGRQDESAQHLRLWRLPRGVR